MRRLALMGVVRGPRTFYSRRNGEVTDPLSLWLQELIARRGYNCTAVALANKNARIEFRPIPPRSPHLNGKVERSQLTDRNEFWSHHAPTEQARQSTCESKSGSSTTTGLGHTAHSVERLLLTALRSWVKSHPSRKRWKVRTTSGKSEFGTANGGSTSSSANIIGGRRNPCRLSAPRVPTRQRNGLQESETMSANRTAELRMVSRPLRGQRAHRTLEAAPQRAQARSARRYQPPVGKRDLKEKNAATCGGIFPYFASL
ncbi:integrase catalytic subunit [Burkholderia pseudomallei]|nr:integrase catalytic subunit [Burkholderia pseudomallei]CAJ3170046.1 integrase catalytic subunit [Burkholderia pseudomallei]VBI74159.1 integrase catalytic subunit [Burkholderia pseudomallei]VBQ02984.1 integrase catalytic subunit [Burkholderia pseudomallei]VCK24910.1 integrase catalytic subunit [Burkholderia pseudomallei]